MSRSKSDTYPIFFHHECAHFRPFSAILCILGPTCTMFSPPCTPEAWNNGPYMACCLCILVPMTHMPHGWTKAQTLRELAQGECGIFCQCHLCVQFRPTSCYGLWRSRKPSTYGPSLDSHWVPHQTRSPVSKPPWRYTLGDTFIFGTIFFTSNTPFWDPNFSPPCGQLTATYLCAHEESGLNFKSCT